MMPVFKPLPLRDKFIVKSLRFDSFCFIDEFIEGITRVSGQGKGRPLRIGPHKAWTVNGLGVFDRRDKAKSPYPKEEQYKRPWFSAHQSLSLILKGAEAPVFGFNTGRASTLAGVMMAPESALINRRFLYDTGTCHRPYEARTKKEAEAYRSQAMGTSLFADDASFEAAIRAKENAGRYNEVLAGVRWEMETSAVGIFSDTDESRYVAQIYAMKIRRALQSKAGMLPEAWNGAYQVPVYYYLPGQAKNAQEHTLADMVADRQKANRILKDVKTREVAFDEGRFACLLLAGLPQEALSIVWKGRPIVLGLIGLGLFHIAEGLVANAGHASIADYLAANGLVGLALETCTASDYDTAPFVRSDQRALLECLTKATGQSDINGRLLLMAAQMGHADVVPQLLAKGADTGLMANNGWTALILATQNGHTEIVAQLLAKGADTGLKNKHGGTALMVAAQNGHAEIVAQLLAKGADTGLKDNDGWTALRLAAQNGHKDIVIKLQQTFFYRSLDNYIAITNGRLDNDKKYTCTFFGYKFGGLGFSALQKKQAAQALYDVVHNGHDFKARCRPEDIKALNNGQLKRVYQQYLEVAPLLTRP